MAETRISRPSGSVLITDFFDDEGEFLRREVTELDAESPPPDVQEVVDETLIQAISREIQPMVPQAPSGPSREALGVPSPGLQSRRSQQVEEEAGRSARTRGLASVEERSAEANENPVMNTAQNVLTSAGSVAAMGSGFLGIAVAGMTALAVDTLLVEPTDADVTANTVGATAEVASSTGINFMQKVLRDTTFQKALTKTPIVGKFMVPARLASAGSSTFLASTAEGIAQMGLTRAGLKTYLSEEEQALSQTEWAGFEFDARVILPGVFKMAAGVLREGVEITDTLMARLSMTTGVSPTDMSVGILEGGLGRALNWVKRNFIAPERTLGSSSKALDEFTDGLFPQDARGQEAYKVLTGSSKLNVPTSLRGPTFGTIRKATSSMRRLLGDEALGLNSANVRDAWRDLVKTMDARQFGKALTKMNLPKNSTALQLVKGEYLKHGIIRKAIIKNLGADDARGFLVNAEKGESRVIISGAKLHADVQERIRSGALGLIFDSNELSIIEDVSLLMKQADPNSAAELAVTGAEKGLQRFLNFTGVRVMFSMFAGLGGGALASGGSMVPVAAAGTVAAASMVGLQTMSKRGYAFGLPAFYNMAMRNPEAWHLFATGARAGDLQVAQVGLRSLLNSYARSEAQMAEELGGTSINVVPVSPMTGSIN